MGEHYVGFDPGKTTGFAQAVYEPAVNVLTVVDMDPIFLNTRHKSINMDNPPIPCFKDFWERVNLIYATFAQDFPSSPDDLVPMHTAIEDFVGGTGGDLQNTVNKLIGIIMACCMTNADVYEFSMNITQPKVYKNVTRYKFLAKVKEIMEGMPGISHHSKDALAHLLHRVEAEHPGSFKGMEIRFDLKPGAREARNPVGQD